MFTVALFTIAKTWKQPECPLMDGQVDEENMKHTHTDMHTHIGNDTSFSHKKKETVLSVTTWMESESITLNEIS